MIAVLHQRSKDTKQVGPGGDRSETVGIRVGVRPTTGYGVRATPWAGKRRGYSTTAGEGWFTFDG